MLNLHNVRKSFGKTVAVDGLSLSVRKGEVLGLLGPNGAGKSTSVSLAVGLLAPDAGSVTIEDVGHPLKGCPTNPADPRVRQKIGVAPQALALYDLLTADENLRFFGRVYGLSGATLDARVAWALDFVGLTDRRSDRAGTYSGGMKRRRCCTSPTCCSSTSRPWASTRQTMMTNPTASSSMVDKALADMRQSGVPPEQAAPVRRFLGELKSFVNTPASQGPPGSPQSEWQPLKVTAKDVARERRGPDNAFDVTFPQGVIWGLIGCVMTFGISLVTERTHGTLVRLRMAPLTRAQILGGKATACFVSILIVELMLLGVALALGVRPTSYPMLALAGLSSAVCFVGFMMLIASLGKTEQSASGAAWAIMMPLSMFGGAMVPTFVMPPWMQTAGLASPIRWALLAIEGGVWRNFTLAEMVLPCGILILVGIVCFVVGTRALGDQ